MCLKKYIGSEEDFILEKSLVSKTNLGFEAFLGRKFFLGPKQILACGWELPQYSYLSPAKLGLGLSLAIRSNKEPEHLFS